MLDAGHYGNYNQSPVYPEYYEAQQMWKLHLLLKKHLEKYDNVEVFQTRKEQKKDLAVAKRGECAKDCDIFISLHSNAANSSSVDRVDIFYSYQNLNNAKNLAESLGRVIADCMGIETNNAKTRKSTQGDWEYYGVLRGAASVGCPLYYIVEHSFHTNVESCKWLMSDENLDKLAQAEARVIAEYYGLKLRYALGDINQDGEVDMFDHAMLKSAIRGQLELTDEQAALADVNQDGDVNIFDYLWTKKSLLEDETRAEFNLGDQVKVNKDATTYANGKTIKDWVKASVLYVRGIESNGDILLLSTEKDAPEYTGRFNAADVYKI